MQPDELEAALNKAIDAPDPHTGIILASTAIVAAALSAHGGGKVSPSTEWEVRRRARFGARMVVDALAGAVP